MTSRPPMGGQPRQPQRSLSGTGLPQRPPHQRTLSQQYLPPSPIRKESFLDFNSPDPNDVTQSRTGTFRRGGSRLKLELSNEAITDNGLSESPNALDSTKVITPSRIMPMPVGSDLGDMSPHPSTQAPSADNDSERLPMPPRRKRFSLPVPRRDALPTVPAPVVTKRDSRPKPWIVEVPPTAPHYIKHSKESQGKSAPGSSSNNSSSGQARAYADFFPWTGDQHAEDTFSDNAIRHGFFDKAPINGAGTETQSAKALIFPLLKHKSGLNMLSQIFTGVLGQRRHSGQVNTDSQFKLPPRVTVTDTRREAWLKELANPEIPLRKLSRTIPHGVRGKVFFDQCLNKKIPIHRAVWLAKCCGSQDLRSLRRKGVGAALHIGGEAKWIREWTVHTEQFVECRISAFREAEWNQKVNYAIRLATALFAEHLLDREHYLDWLISSLESSGQAKLPMWILLAQIYLDDILSLRRNGRRLVNALLSHHLTIQSSPDKDILQPLAAPLTCLLISLLLRSPENFISPTTWSKYRDALSGSLPADDDGICAAFKSINSRNEQLVANTIRSQPAARNSTVKQLDLTLQSSISDGFPEECWNIGKDKTALVKTVLQWCTSLYRPGLAKVYISTRLLTSWSKLGVDATAAVLDFLDLDPLEEPGRKALFYHLVSELVRCGDFSVSRYMQWLIARGGLTDAADVAPDGRVATRLLVELPIHAMSDSLRKLRANTLRRARYPMDSETQDTDMAMKCLRHTLGFPLDPNDPMLQRKPMSASKLAKHIRQSSRALKTEIGAWLRNNFRTLERASEDAKDILDVPVVTFNAVRAILEAADDYTMLAEILKTVTGMSNIEVLGSCADTVSLHVTTFAAIGVARGIFDTLLGRLRPIAELQGVGARPLLASLSTLAPRLPGLEELGSQLQKDLVKSDKSNAVDVCSPVSDNMALRLQDSEGDLHEEIEKLLSTGTSLDRNTMERLFGNVVGGLQSCWNKQDEALRAYSTLLARLRLFDAPHFDKIMSKWLLRVRVSTDRPSILQIFPVLVCLESLSIPIILSTTADPPSAGNGPSSTPSLVQNTWRSRYVQEVLQLMTAPITRHPLLKVEECYQFAIKQSQARIEHSNELLALIRNSMAEYSICRQQNASDLPLDKPEMQKHVWELLKSLVLLDPIPVARALAVKNADPAVGTLIEAMTTKLLIPDSPEGMQISFDQVLGLTNEFTLPFCQLKLTSSLALGDSSGPDASERMQSHLEMFVKAMDNAVGAKNITWTGMLSSLSPEITQHLKNSAQARFFEVLPSLKSPPPADRSLPQSVQMAENLLSVVDAIVRGGAMGRPPQLVASMVDKLADLWEALAHSDGAARRAVVAHWLPDLLTFLILHSATFDASKASNEVRAKALVVLAGLLQELDALQGLGFAPGLGPGSGGGGGGSGGEGEAQAGPAAVRHLQERVFDLALLLVDNLADDARAQCIRALKDAAGDARLRYIFSFAPPPNENLMLWHREKPAAAGAARGQGGAAAAAAAAGTGAGAGAGAGAAWGGVQQEKLSKFVFRRWEIISDPNPVVQENDSSLNMSLFEAIKL